MRAFYKIIFLVLLLLTPTVFASSYFFGEITQVNDQTFKVKSDEKEIESIRDQTIHADYKVGDRVLVYTSEAENGELMYFVADFARYTPLLYLFILFVLAVIFVAKKWGFASLIGMFYSFVIIFKFILPNLLQGYNPLFVAILSALLISPVTFVLSHGANKKTYIALLGTFISLLITGILAGIFINLSKLTGYGSEETLFLQLANLGQIDVKGLLLAGIIISTLGILDDVTVSQASIVHQLADVDKTLSAKELYARAMSVGHDHISSAVNTLVLVYAGAALPLMLLFSDYNRSFIEVINNEVIAEEIIRTLVGSIGLVLSVPITTILAVKVFRKEGFRK